MRVGDWDSLTTGEAFFLDGAFTFWGDGSVDLEITFGEGGGGTGVVFTDWVGSEEVHENINDT